MTYEQPTPVADLAGNPTAPNVDSTRMRSDFFAIWRNNVTVAVQLRRTDSEAGNYGSDDEAVEFEVNKEIYLDIQGRSSGSYTQEVYGLNPSPSILHAYALHTESFTSRDNIIWKDIRYGIKNLNESRHDDGSLIFIEFDLDEIDKDKDSYKN